MNPNRRIIFQYLCRHPCSEMGEITRAVGYSRSTVKWHLEVLASFGYVQAHKGKRMTYSPFGLVSRNNIDAVSALANKRCMAIFLFIGQNPGSDPSAIGPGVNAAPPQTRSCLAELLDAGLIIQMKDGKHSRYFPTDRYNELVREERKSQREFIRYMMGKLSAEHLRPELVELKGSDMVISINALGQPDKIFIPANVLSGMGEG